MIICSACDCIPKFMRHVLGMKPDIDNTDTPPWRNITSITNDPPWKREDEDENTAHNIYRTTYNEPGNHNDVTNSTRVDLPRNGNKTRGMSKNSEYEQSYTDSEHTPETRTHDWGIPGYYTEGDIQSKRQTKLLYPKNTTDLGRSSKSALTERIAESIPLPSEVRRSWPEPREKGVRKIISANYAAVEIHGFFGLIDDGSVGEGRMLIVHVPKWIRGYFLDIKQGDTLHVYHAKGRKIGGALTVLSTGRHKYYAPGRRVTTCTICIPEEQWTPFVQ
jgi:hypothetical protein